MKQKRIDKVDGFNRTKVGLKDRVSETSFVNPCRVLIELR